MANYWNTGSINDISQFAKRMFGNSEYYRVMRPYMGRAKKYGAKVYRANTFMRASKGTVFAHTDVRRAIYRHNAKVTLKYGVAGAAIGMTAYGLTSFVGNRRKTKAGRAFARTSYAMGRVVSVPAHFAYGGVKGALSPMSTARVFDVRAGARRALKSAEGYNSITNRRNTMYARQRRQTIIRNRKARATVSGGPNQNTPPQLTKQQRQQMARRRRRVKGKFA